MKRSRACQSSGKCRKIFKMKSSSRKGRRRRVLSTIENLDNLSSNTKRYLKRRKSKKRTDDGGKINKLTRSMRRRHSGSSGISSGSSGVSSGSSSVSSDSVHSSPKPIYSIEEISIIEDISIIEETSALDDVEKSDELMCENLNGKEDSVDNDDESVFNNGSSTGSECGNLASKIEVLALAVPSDSDNSSEVDWVNDDLETKADSIKPDASYKLRTPQKCKYCHETNVVMYSGPPSDSRNEAEILNLEDLNVSPEDGEDELPQYRLTEFSVFDKADHLCPFDGDLIQKKVRLFFSGYIKPIYDDDPKIEGGHPCMNMGPITEWWIAGLDGSESEKVVLGFSSERADYYLLQATTEYAPFLEELTEKTRVTKMVFQFLLSKATDDVKTYEELLAYLESQNVDEEKLIRFANFIYEQTLSYDSEADEDEMHLLNSECMQHLAQLAEIEPTEKIRIRRVRRIRNFRIDPINRKATITPLVQNCFEPIFTDQMDTCHEEVELKPRQCQVKLIRLTNLQRYAGAWKIQSNMKFGEDSDLTPVVKEALKNKLIKPCHVQLKTLSPEILDKYLCRLKINDNDKLKRKLSSDDDSEEEIEYLTKKERKFNDDKVTWRSEAEEIDNKTHYSCAQVGDELVRLGNFVSLKYGHKVGLVKYMFEDRNKKTLVHLHWFVCSYKTILGETGAKQELFMTDDCEDINLSDIDSVLDVEHLFISINEWREKGNYIVSEWLAKNSNARNKFFYQKRYDGRYGVFKDLPDDVDVSNTCTNCSRKTELENREIPLPIGDEDYDEETKEYTLKKVRWRDEDFCVGTSVFLRPGSLIECKTTPSEPRTEERYDEIEYPEKYRKKFTSDDEGKENPFDVGFITRIFTKKHNVRKSKDVRIEVKKLYRPQNTHLDRSEADKEDLNKLYWTEEECVLRFDEVEGKCFLAYKKNLKLSLEDWSEEGPNRFYFSQAYDPGKERFIEPPFYATNIGKVSEDIDDANVPYNHPVVEPLATMDVFAGCGGLSEGLHQSGVAECRWAIEKFTAPAEAFRLNNPKAEVFQNDCNDLLLDMMDPRVKEHKKLPKRGEVELLCGGPPCQGFSRMNRFRNGTYSKFKNSLVTTYLSYCDHFRPRFFILENVRDFISTSGAMVFKLTVSCLVRMGYQVGFSVLQCGRYGIPQSRRRTIILAAAPGEILPKFPEPTHTFPLNSFLDVTIRGERYKTDVRWTKSAPYRTITVGDAISDLPKIENNDNKHKMQYKTKAQTHFQKKMRGTHSGAEDILQDHVCKKLAPLILKRISYIPREPPGDWRDLPNIEVRLNDGTLVKKLKYTHEDWKHPMTSKGQLRGVCVCATDRNIKCKESGSKQKDTLIPWCLPHTSNRHNQWSGLYGRVPKDSYFRTVVTNPEPMGKQGRVVHPDQDRVVSVRECARSQGFKDSHQFYGDILDKYAQIGNAVAPPLGKAIGLEIRKSIAAKIAKDRGTISDCIK